MGTWGTKVYQNDISSCVRDDLKNKLRAGKNDTIALKEILEEYEDCILDDDDKYDFWFGLADTLWTLGRLTNEVKDKAIEMIGLEEKTNRWETEKDRKERRKVLDELNQKLISEMPPLKKISVYKPFVSPWKPGDVYVYQVKNPGIDESYKPPKDCSKYIGWYITLFVEKISRKDVKVTGVFDEVPIVYMALSEEKPSSLNEAKNLKILRAPCISRNGLYEYRWVMHDTSIRKYPKDLVYLGNTNSFAYPSNEYIDMEEVNFIFWNTIEIWAIRSYEWYEISSNQ